MFRGCDAVGGNALDWVVFSQAEVVGDVTIESPADCTIPDEFITDKRNNHCKGQNKDGCVGPAVALFDGNPHTTNKWWRCYFKNSVAQDNMGLTAYNASSNSPCFINKYFKLKDIY